MMTQIFAFTEQPLAEHFLITTSVPRGMLQTAPLKYRSEAVKTAIGEAIDNARQSPDGSVACRLSFDPKYLSVVPVLRMMTPTDVLRMSAHVERGEILLKTIHLTKVIDRIPFSLLNISDAIRETGKADPKILHALKLAVLKKNPKSMVEALDSLYSCALEQMAAYQKQFVTPELTPEQRAAVFPLPTGLQPPENLGLS